MREKRVILEDQTDIAVGRGEAVISRPAR
jgi:hypothetical protein